MFENVLTREVLEDLYVNNGWSITAIARKFEVSAKTVRNYITKYEIAFRPMSEDLSGKRFGRLLVIKRQGKDRHGKYRWSCLCDCGKTTEINGSSLTRNLTTSCGCYKHELCTRQGYKDISYSHWRRLLQNAKQRGYAFEITPEYIWEVFENQDKKCVLSGLDIVFCSDSNKRHEQTASIDRINSNVGYVPGNIQIVHKVVNQMKSYLTDEEFIAFCNLVADKHRREHEDSINNASRKILRKV